MGELGEQMWSVISERGCEASGLAYAEAAALMRQLASERVYGLCIVTNESARHLPPVKILSSTASRPPEAQRNKS
jgi:hypothetical protein